MKLQFLLFLILFTASLFPQQESITVQNGSVKKDVPVYERQGTVYISVTDFADAAGIEHYYSKASNKLVLKFDAKNLIITAKNPFLVIEGKEKETYQLPTSTYTIGNKIYIPLRYSISTIKKLYSGTIELKGDVIAVKSKNGKEPEKPEVTKTNFDITGITLDVKANGTLVKVKSKKKIPSYNSTYKNGVLTIIFRSVTADAAAIAKTETEGIIKEIKVINLKNDVEFKFTLSKEFTASEVLNADKGNDILITLHNKVFVKDSDNRNKDRWNFDVIVLDAGHGGKDYGAIGTNGTREKDINLAVALKLGKLIEQNLKGVKVVYTRDDDTFIELYKRGKIANDHGGKLFISIHCNSTPQKPTDATGFEVYLLRPGRTKEAISIAERENSVIKYEDNPKRYQKLTDENFILVSMAHSSYMKYSEKFSELLNKDLGKGVVIPSRGIKQAGFYVLVGASMPSVLVETGFISNKRDEAYIKSGSGQEQIAESILESIKKFKAYYTGIIEQEK